MDSSHQSIPAKRTQQSSENRDAWGDDKGIERRRWDWSVILLVSAAILSLAYITLGLLRQRAEMANSTKREQEQVRAKLESLLLSFRYVIGDESHLPAPAITNGQGEIAFSWRVRFSYRDLDLVNGHWKDAPKHYSDSWNKECPDTFQLARTRQGNERCTCIAMITGPGTVFENHPAMSCYSLVGPRTPEKKTAIIMELPKSDLYWMEPFDVNIDEAVRLIRESQLPGGTFLGFSDGTVEPISADTPENEIRQLFVANK